MNVDYLLQRIAGRPTCTLSATAKLLRYARIRNARRDSSLIRIGAHSIIQGELLLFPNSGEIEIGEWCYVGEGTRIWSAKRVSIGNRALISHNVNIFDNATHPLSAAERHRQFRGISEGARLEGIELDEREVAISSDSLIGANSVIMRGVTIGEGSIVGAGSVVTKDVPSHHVVAGNPARILRELSEHES